MTLDELLRKLVYHSGMSGNDQREAHLLLDELNALNVFGNVQRNLNPKCEHIFEWVEEASPRNPYAVIDRYWLCKKCHQVSRTLKRGEVNVSG